MPFFIPKGDIFMVTYKLQKFIRSELFNHKTFAKSFEINSFTQNEITLPCNRENVPFIYPEHDRIFTGDLIIVNNIKLRKLITNGPKYRQLSTKCWNKAVINYRCNDGAVD